MPSKVKMKWAVNLPTQILPNSVNIFNVLHIKYKTSFGFSSSEKVFDSRSYNGPYGLDG